MKRHGLTILVCLIAVAILPNPGVAASLTGASSVPLSKSTQLTATYSDDYPVACGTGSTAATCFATFYEHYADGGKHEIECGDETGGEGTYSCKLGVAGSPFGVDDPLTQSYSTTYEACEGHDQGCATKSVEWTPWPMQMTLMAADAGGSVRVANGGHGWPDRGYLEIYDENRRELVKRVDASTFDPRTFELSGCAGPYFTARYVPYRVGSAGASTGVTRVNGISDNGTLCHDDPPGGGDPGDGEPGGGAGGGDEDPPEPPVATIEGPGSVSVLEPAKLTVRPSTAMEYPYWLLVRDASRDNAVIASCPARNAEGCEFDLYGDLGAKTPEVHQLVASTELGNDQVKSGATKEVTFEPFRTSARIALRGVKPAETVGSGTTSAGTVTLNIGNVDPTSVYGYSVHLQSRNPADVRPRWGTVDSCPQFAPLNCDINVVAPAQPSADEPLELQFRAVVYYGNEVRDVKVLQPSVQLFHGVDYRQMQTAAAVAGPSICLYVITDYNHRGERYQNTTLNKASAYCAGLLGAGYLAFNALNALLKENPEIAGEIAAAVLRAISAAGEAVDVPSPGGGTTTTSGKAVYDEEILEIAKSLRRLNKGVAELTLSVAKVVAAGCLAHAAYQGMSALVGAQLGPGFCRKPDMPIFVVGADVNEAAQHDFDAIYGHVGRNVSPNPRWSVLNYSSTSAKVAAGQNRRWYRYKTACVEDKQPDQQCDEYPFMSTEQGGKPAVPEPSLRLISKQANEDEGILLNQKLYRRCGLNSASGVTKTSNGTGGDRYLVLPLPLHAPQVPSLIWEPIVEHVPLTFGFCNRGASGGGGSSAS